MDWERASPSSEAVVVVAGDKKNKCNKPTANDLSNNNNPTRTTGQLVSRKNKPIPPPLDLSIGAANLSLHHQNQSKTHPNLHASSSSHRSSSSSSSTHHHCSSNNQPQSQPWDLHLQQSPLPSYLGSPKFSQSEKSLPLRKRWQSLSWSPTLMNGQEESFSPSLYDAHLPSPLVKSELLQGDGSGGGGGGGLSAENGQHQNLHQTSYPYPVSTGASTTSSAPLGGITAYRLPYGQQNGHINSWSASSSSSSLGQGGGLSIQTPSPFSTPNETSPKFMNSPVFSYSTPDTTLYQGPFSPMRSSLYPPPSSPFTNLNLNTPGGPMSTGGLGSTCFSNMIPSTLLSPAPSQASTNSLSYEDLHEKSLNLFTPVWSIFTLGTRVRFNDQMNPMDWYSVEFLAQNENLLNFKGDYAPHGLEVRTLVVTSSSKERIQVTFCPVADPDHPSIEVDCEPGHPFMVDKKGWCSVKPDVFLEAFGITCQKLECGDICLNLSPRIGQNLPFQQSLQSGVTNNVQEQLQQQQSSQQQLATISSSYSLNLNNSNSNNSVINVNLSVSTSPNLTSANHHQQNMSPAQSHNHHSLVKMEPGVVSSMDEKMVPISVLPHHTMHHQSHAQSHQLLGSSPSQASKKFALPSSMCMVSSSGGLPAPSAPMPSPAKRVKEGQQPLTPTEQKGRRPMNAFLLFAKDKRPELIQQFPGKDNRSISVLLGEAWANLEPPEKERYSLSARAKAEEQKRIHPDCWKRKRSQSTSS